MQKKKAYVCPECGSTNIAVKLFGGSRSERRCRDCGFEGVMLDVDADKVKDVQAELKRRKK